MLLRHCQTERESLSSTMLRDNYSLDMCICIIYAEIDIVILSDALFLHLLVVRDMFNMPRTEMEPKYLVSPYISGNSRANLHSLHLAAVRANGQWNCSRESHSCSQLQSPIDTDLFIFCNFKKETLNK